MPCLQSLPSNRGVLVGAIEEAILAAAKRTFGLERNLVAEFSEEKGAVELSQAIVVVEEIQDSFNELTVDEAAEQGIEVEAGVDVGPFQLLVDEAPARSRPARWRGQLPAG